MKRWTVPSLVLALSVLFSCNPPDTTPPMLSVPPVDLSMVDSFFAFGAANSPGGEPVGLIGYFSDDPNVQVRASAPGIVIEIAGDAATAYGITISPSGHSIWRVVYSGVINPTVSKGNSVSAGDILGKIAPPIWGPVYWTHLILKQTALHGDGLAYCPLDYATQSFIDQHEAIGSNWCLLDTTPPPD
jgi:hypothetical protein